MEKTYRVTLYCAYTYEVDAETEEEAVELAKNQWDDYTDPIVEEIVDVTGLYS